MQTSKHIIHDDDIIILSLFLSHAVWKWIANVCIYVTLVQNCILPFPTIIVVVALHLVCLGKTILNGNSDIIETHCHFTYWRVCAIIENRKFNFTYWTNRYKYELQCHRNLYFDLMPTTTNIIHNFIFYMAQCISTVYITRSFPIVFSYSWTQLKHFLLIYTLHTVYYYIFFLFIFANFHIHCAACVGVFFYYYSFSFVIM